MSIPDKKAAMKIPMVFTPDLVFYKILPHEWTEDSAEYLANKFHDAASKHLPPNIVKNFQGAKNTFKETHNYPMEDQAWWKDLKERFPTASIREHEVTDKQKIIEIIEFTLKDQRSEAEKFINGSVAFRYGSKGWRTLDLYKDDEYGYFLQTW